MEFKFMITFALYLMMGMRAFRTCKGRTRLQSHLMPLILGMPPGRTLPYSKAYIFQGITTTIEMFIFVEKKYFCYQRFHQMDGIPILDEEIFVYNRVIRKVTLSSCLWACFHPLSCR